MSETQLALPTQFTRGKSLTVVIAALTMNVFMMIGVFIYLNFQVQPSRGSGDTPMLYSIVGVLIVIDILMGAFFMQKMKPAVIDISRTSVTVTPTPVLGFVCGKQASFSTSEFTGVGLEKFQGKGGCGYQVVLRGKEEIMVDTPKNTSPQDFARQLAAALNLEVKLDA